MLRDKSLIPLSHQHQHALALCVRIERASPIPSSDLSAWQTEIAQLFRSEIAAHFAAEEQVLFPVASEDSESKSLVEDLLNDHQWLGDQFARSGNEVLSAENLNALAQRLSAHIRKEERQLFEGLQKKLSAQRLGQLGAKLETALKDVPQVCSRPDETTQLRPRK